jgi:hypothetical protein
MSTALTPEEREERLLMLLLCVKLAGERAAAGSPGADVFAIINVFGKVHPQLLDSVRERLMTELRRRDWVRTERRSNQVYWILTSAGIARAAADPSRESDLKLWIGPQRAGPSFPR